MKKRIKKVLISALVAAMAGCCVYTHRRVIHAWLNGEPMPKAPKWHCWVRPESRRS